MRNRKRVSGFTLVELVVVIAIIGALAGVLAPNMIAYYRNSRVRDVNSKAKLVYNAAQTEVQKFISIDRAADQEGIFGGLMVLSYRADTGVISMTSAGIESGLISVAGTENEDACQQVVASMNRVISDGADISWTICIEDYIVKGCMCTDQYTSRYVGTYSARMGDGTKSPATEMADESYESLISSGSKLQAAGSIMEFSEQFYGVDGYGESAEEGEGEEGGEGAE